MPSIEQLFRVLTLEDYNTRVVVIGVMALGAASGVIGTFLLLRKRALTADALSHATLPGIVAAFMVIVAFGGSGKSIIALLIGAFVSGCIGVLLILAIRHTTRLKDDAAIGIVLSVLFGLGLCLLRIATEMPGGSVAGLKGFVFGKAASMVAGDAWIMCIVATGVVALVTLFRKEFTLLCFDEKFSTSQGWPILKLDIALMGMVAIVTVIALQSVGLVLAVAMLIIPAASSRYWSTKIANMIFIAALIGALSGWLGATVSALVPRMPTGPIIVLISGCSFVVSFMFGTKNGFIVNQLERSLLNRRIAMQHFLRAMWEITESNADNSFHFKTIVAHRSWKPPFVRRLVKRAICFRYCSSIAKDVWIMTEKGSAEATRIARNHRLWEIYLINYADIAPSHVDRDADAIEHVIGQVMVDKLEALIKEENLKSPHPIGVNQ